LDSSPLSDRFREFNKVHSALKWMSKCYSHSRLRCTRCTRHSYLHQLQPRAMHRGVYP
jgi:hypothetical protein